MPSLNSGLAPGHDRVDYARHFLNAGDQGRLEECEGIYQFGIVRMSADVCSNILIARTFDVP